MISAPHSSYNVEGEVRSTGQGRNELADQSTQQETLDEWFVRTVLPHEAPLTRFLHRNWKGDPEEVGDLRQDAYMRVYAAAKTERPSQPKAFLFSTARNLMVDRIRREQIVHMDLVIDFDALNVSVDEALPDEQLSAREELRLLQDALNALPAKCREIVMLRKVFGYSQRETAERLGVSVATVEGQSQRGVRKLAEALSGVSERAARKVALFKLGRRKEEKG